MAPARAATRIRSDGGGVLDLFDDNILLKVLERLGDRYDRHAWCLTCKHFLKLEASTRVGIQVLRQEALGGVLRRYPNVADLDLSQCPLLGDGSLQLVGEIAGHRLRCLNLSRAWGFSSQGLRLLASHCYRLLDINLGYCSSSLKDEELLSISRLRSLRVLNLMGCHSISDIGLSCLAAGCQLLRQLNLRGCLGITDMGVGVLASKCRQLQTLDLSYTEVTVRALRVLAGLESLQVLNLVACGNVDDEGLLQLQQGCKSLQKLDVSKCLSVTAKGVAGLASAHVDLQHLSLSYCLVVTNELLQTFRKLGGLQSIVLDGCQIADEGLQALAKGCSLLKELSLSKSAGVNDKGIAAIASGCWEIRSLNLTCCRELTNDALIHISKSCRLLKSLKMEACSLVNEAGLIYLGEGCPQLEELDFTESNMNDAGLEHISKCSVLRSLKLGFCLEISDEGIAHIGARCSELLELDFYRSKAVGDAGLAAIAAGCPKLRSLDLSYCLGITDTGLQCLASLKDLRRLDLRGCLHVSSVGLSVMASGCRLLTEVDLKMSQIGDNGVIALSRFCPCIRVMNLSHCPISDAGLSDLWRLSCLHILRLVLNEVTLECFTEVLTSCTSLRNIRLPAYLKLVLPPGVIKEVESRGCRIRWMEKGSLSSAIRTAQFQKLETKGHFW